MSQHSLYIFPMRQDDGTITYPMSTSKKKKPLPGAPYPTPDLGRNSGKHGIDFNIEDLEKIGVTFSKNDPIWINETGCPQVPGIFTDQIKGYYLRNVTQLELDDLNKGMKRTLHYRLNFDVDGTPDYLDPEIKNGGSGPGISKFFALLGVAVAVATAAYVAYEIFFDN